jgi:uncharacterized protein YifN (PemK superfamily)
MALPFQPGVKSIVLCDFTGFKVPEMVKRRHVVVIAKNKKNPRLVTIVPLSTTAPFEPDGIHHRLSGTYRWGTHDSPKDVWAKCDMIYTISTDRLNGLFRKRAFGEKRREYFTENISDADFLAIRRSIRAALGFD